MHNNIIKTEFYTYISLNITVYIAPSVRTPRRRPLFSKNTVENQSILILCTGQFDRILATSIHIYGLHAVKLIPLVSAHCYICFVVSRNSCDTGHLRQNPNFNFVLQEYPS